MTNPSEATPDEPNPSNSSPNSPSSRPSDSASTPSASSPSTSSPEQGSAGLSATTGSPRDRFEQQVAAKRGSLDDHDPEETLWSGGYSPKAMVGWWVTLAIISIGLIVIALLRSELPFGVALIIIAVLWVLVLANYARMRLGFHYELTSQRFIHKTGILTRRSDRIEVIDIDDVSYEQGPIQRIFGVGKINITSSDRSDPELHLLGIDKVSEVAGLIDDVRRSERRRRSLHIESI
ncbi:PH domain-containing protein [Neorhodopirellula pilleata]|nr:PH domain-containing protein [Neorhodopirellula pilleata]